MLVMIRRPGDAILIGDGIEIQILETSRSKVKIGLIAPKELRILRGEFRTVREENWRAANPRSPVVFEALAREILSADRDEKSSLRPHSVAPGGGCRRAAGEHPRGG
jgi:carbon storage regulator